MCPESVSPQCRILRSQRGAGLPAAIFLVTIMALIVATIAQLQQTSGQAEALDILSTRAFYAAESGTQHGLAVALQDPDGSSCFNEEALTFNAAGLRGCTATVTCESSGELVRIISRGECGSGADQARRVVEVKAR